MENRREKPSAENGLAIIIAATDCVPAVDVYKRQEFRSAILHENLLFRPGMHYKPMHAVRTRLYEVAHGGSAGHAPEHAAGNTDGNAGRNLREEGNEQ